MNRRTFITSSAAASLSFAAHAAKPGSKLLRVAVIGHTGRGNYGHGLDTMWLEMPEVEIVGYADADEKGRIAEGKKLKNIPAFADYKAMLKEVKPDIVAIGPRHIDQHRDMAMAASEAGARGIYMEKPFCRSLEEADEIIATCTKNGTKLALAHRNRYHPVLEGIQKRIAAGEIGRLLEIRARGKEDARGGSLDLWVLGSHLFNLIHFFGGDPVSCSATVLQAGKPVTRADVVEGAEGIGPLAGNEVHARFMMTSGIPAYFDSIQNAGTKEAGFGVQLIGTKGIIDLRIDEAPFAHILLGSPFDPIAEPRGWLPLSTGGVNVPEPIPNLAKDLSSHRVAGRDLIAAMKENREPLCGAQAARTTIAMITAVFESHRLQGQVVTFPLQTKLNPLTLL